jgi:hypothetical protein
MLKRDRLSPISFSLKYYATINFPVILECPDPHTIEQWYSKVPVLSATNSALLFPWMFTLNAGRAKPCPPSSL